MADLSGTFGRLGLLREVIIKGKSAPTFDDRGRATTTQAPDKPFSAAVLPVTEKDLKHFPEGNLTVQDKKFYFTDSTLVVRSGDNDGDQMTVTNDPQGPQVYQAIGENDRRFEGNYYVVFARQIKRDGN